VLARARELARVPPLTRARRPCAPPPLQIRGLALRSLTGLRLTSILEYVIAPIRSGLTDSSGYVRAAAVMGVLKVFHLAPGIVREEGFVETLYTMLRDREPAVVINCLSVLNEALADEGGVAINQAIAHYLLTRLREFSDWGQCAVLELISRYTPEGGEDEIFGIMNLLDPALKVANSAVVLATTKCFLKLTAALPELQMQVFLRLKTPLLTILASSSAEVAFPVLSHTLLIAGRAPGVFDDEFKQFFCKFNEPTCVKSLKMRILPKIACAANAREIISELAEYVGGVDADLARLGVRAIADIAVRVPLAAELGACDDGGRRGGGRRARARRAARARLAPAPSPPALRFPPSARAPHAAVVEALLEALEMEAEYVRSETVVVMQNLLRTYPERASAVIPSLHRCLKRMEDPAGRAAVIWMFGVRFCGRVAARARARAPQSSLPSSAPRPRAGVRPPD
jgi:AP-4 complex subunit beta-1